MALLGPLFTATTVKVTFWPTFGVALLTALLTEMSVDWPVTVAEALSLEGTGSLWSSAPFVAVLVIVLAPVTVAVTWRVAAAPLASEPMFQTPVPAL